MRDLIKINYDAEQPTVSARELHEGLELEKAWNSPEQVFARALHMADKVVDSLKERCQFLGGQVLEQQKVIEELQPKASYYDMILQCKDFIATTTIAKDYGMSAKKFNTMLHNMGIQFKQGSAWVLYAKYQGNGYLKAKTCNYADTKGVQHSREHSYGTQKAQFIDMFDNLKMEKKPLKSVCIHGPQNGFYRKGAEENGTIPVIKMKELFGNECVAEAEDCALVSLTNDELERFKLTEFDLLFGRRSLVIEGAGKCSRVGQVHRDMIFDSLLLRISLNPEIVRPRFLQMWFKTPEGVNTITSIRAVTTIAGIKGSDLAKIHIPTPPLDKQDEYIELLENGDTSVEELEKTISNLR